MAFTLFCMAFVESMIPLLYLLQTFLLPFDAHCSVCNWLFGLTDSFLSCVFLFGCLLVFASGGFWSQNSNWSWLLVLFQTSVRILRFDYWSVEDFFLAWISSSSEDSSLWKFEMRLWVRFFTIRLSRFLLCAWPTVCAFLYLFITAFCVCIISFSFTEFDWFTFSLFGPWGWHIRCAPPAHQQAWFLMHMHYCVFSALWGKFFQPGSWECVEWFRPKIQQRCVLKASPSFDHLDLPRTRMIKSVTRGNQSTWVRSWVALLKQNQWQVLISCNNSFSRQKTFLRGKNWIK